MPTRPATLLLAAAAALALPATAAAAPPPNDNYLASTKITRADGSLPRLYRDSVDTTEATTQPDLFDPDQNGAPLGGGDPEPTTCDDGTSFGKTVWWDFEPPTRGGVVIEAGGAFDVVVAVHVWDEVSTKITRTLACRNAGAGFERVVLPRVGKGTNYTVQVGGAGDTGGPLDFSLEWLPDRDGDGRRDAIDDCPSQPGIGDSGCPPELRSSPRLAYTVAGSSLRITGLAIDRVPKGARAEVRCGRCGRKVSRRAARAGTLRLRGFAGRVVPAGDRIEVRVTRGRTGSGRYRYGAVGRYYRWPVRAGKLGRRVTRCLQPGSRRPVRCR